MEGEGGGRSGRGNLPDLIAWGGEGREGGERGGSRGEGEGIGYFPRPDGTAGCKSQGLLCGGRGRAKGYLSHDVGDVPIPLSPSSASPWTK